MFLVEANAFVDRLSESSFPICLVLMVSGKPEVLNAVVTSLTIDMVNI
jgi:hypothetical protein